MKTRFSVMRLVGNLRKLKLVAAGLGLAVGVLVSPGANAVLTTCATDTAVVPDGLGVNAVFGVSNLIANGHLFTAVAGRSYTVEVYFSSPSSPQPVQNVRNAALITVNSNANVCNGANMAGVNITSAQEPIGGIGAADTYRASFISSGGLTEIMVTGSPAAGPIANPFNFFLYAVRVTETTLFQPLWGTTGGFHTFWNIKNTTAVSCNAILTLLSPAGTPVATSTKVIPPNGSTEVDTIGLAVGLNQVGNATIAHDCSPGALAVDTFLENITTSAVLPAKIFTRGALR